jgi:alpha-methylacyl-CoA racemase
MVCDRYLRKLHLKPVILYIIILETDACAVPVLTPKEAGKMTSNIPIFHPQVSKQPKAGQYLDPKSIQPGLHTDAVLQDFGFDAGRIKQLKDEGVLGKDSKRVSSKL